MDNICQRLKEVLPRVDDVGGLFIPFMARIGRHKYPFKYLADVSLHRQAMHYDDQINHPEQEGERKFPSSKAMKQLGSFRSSLHELYGWELGFERPTHNIQRAHHG